MGGYADKLQKSAAGVLRPGERIVAAIRAQPRGSVMGTAVGGLVGGVIASRQASKAQAEAGAESLAASWPQGRHAVGLTDQRLLTFNYTFMGKPKDLTGEFPIAKVASVDQGEAKITKSVRFTFADDSSIEVECAKLEKVGDFVSGFKTVKAAGSS